MAEQVDITTSFNLDDLVLAAEEDIFFEDQSFLNDMDVCIKDTGNSDSIIQCIYCTKECKSQRGLSRHVRIKHPESNNLSNKGNTSLNNHLDHDQFFVLIKKSFI